MPHHVDPIGGNLRLHLDLDCHAVAAILDELGVEDYLIEPDLTVWFGYERVIRLMPELPFAEARKVLRDVVRARG